MSSITNITVNGKRITVPGGRSVSVINGTVIVDGKVYEEGLQGVVTLKIEGDVPSIHSDASIEVAGAVRGNATSGGSLHCGDVGGNVSAGGSVHAGRIAGTVNAGGSVRGGR